MCHICCRKGPLLVRRGTILTRTLPMDNVQLFCAVFLRLTSVEKSLSHYIFHQTQFIFILHLLIFRVQYLFLQLLTKDKANGRKLNQVKYFPCIQIQYIIVKTNVEGLSVANERASVREVFGNIYVIAIETLLIIQIIDV